MSTENACHKHGCEAPSCCFNNEIEVQHCELKYFQSAVYVQTEAEARALIKENPDDDRTFIVMDYGNSRRNILDIEYPWTTHLAIFPKACINLDTGGNCTKWQDVDACRRAKIGGPECTACRTRDDKEPIVISIDEIK